MGPVWGLSSPHKHTNFSQWPQSDHCKWILMMTAEFFDGNSHRTLWQFSEYFKNRVGVSVVSLLLQQQLDQSLIITLEHTPISYIKPSARQNKQIYSNKTHKKETKQKQNKKPLWIKNCLRKSSSIILIILHHIFSI